MKGRPRIRAGTTNAFLRFLEESHPGASEHLRMVLPANIYKCLVEAGRADFHDVERVHGPYVTALVAWLGKEEATEMWRRYIAERARNFPATRGIVQTARNLFGLSIGSFIKMTLSFGYHQTFHDCAELVFETSTRHATATLSLTPEFAKYEAYASLLHGIFKGIISLVEAEERVNLVFEADFARRRMVGRCSW